MRLPDARTPRPLELIEAEIKGLEEDKEVTAWNQGRKDKATETIYRHLMLGMLVCFRPSSKVNLMPEHFIPSHGGYEISSPFRKPVSPMMARCASANASCKSATALSTKCCRRPALESRTSSKAAGPPAHPRKPSQIDQRRPRKLGGVVRRLPRLHPITRHPGTDQGALAHAAPPATKPPTTKRSRKALRASRPGDCRQCDDWLDQAHQLPP